LNSTLESKALEVWQSGKWTWYVLKKWQNNDNEFNAKWLCAIVNPDYPSGHIEDVLVEHVKRQAVRVK